MKMSGQERIAASRNRVWEALNDVSVLQQCIPGCQSLQFEAADQLRAVVEVKIGPIGARFNSTIMLTEVQPPQGYTLIGSGQGGTVGSAKAAIKVRLIEEGAATLLSYEVDAQVAGRLAQLGGPLIDVTAKQFAAKFFKKFAEQFGGAPAAVAPEVPRIAGAPATRVAATSRTLPIGWVLALAVAFFTGFLIGRGQGEAGSDWMGLAIGLLVVIVAAAGVEFGRRVAAPQIVLDAALLERLLRGDKS